MLGTLNKKTRKLNRISVKINNYNLINETDKFKVEIKPEKIDTNITDYCLQIYFKSRHKNIFDFINATLNYANIYNLSLSKNTNFGK